MSRLCERPGCSDSASVAYGMRPENLVFWLDAINSDNGDGGVLCQRHADSMSVPRGWTLDDLREAELHLFRPPEVEPTPGRVRRSHTGTDGTEAIEQLELGVVVASPVESSPAEHASVGALPDGDDRDANETRESASAESAPAEGDRETWAPSFDHADDLDGLLSARSPLLARAFRGNDRPRT